MIIYQYKCLKCERRGGQSVFEVEYDSAEIARSAGTPPCPNGHGSGSVVRHYGASFYTSRKSNKGPMNIPEEAVKQKLPSPPPLPPDRYKKYEPEADNAGIVSLGFRVDARAKEIVDKHVKELQQLGKAEVIDPKRENYPEEIFGLKKDTPERKLFDIKQKKMHEELREGEPVAGFFMPLGGGGEFSSN